MVPVASLSQSQIGEILATKQTPPRKYTYYPPYNAWGTHSSTHYRPGVIIRADNICTKTRPAIVIDAAPRSYTVLPIFTQQGRGLSNKPPQTWNQYMSVCDSREGSWYQQQNEMPALLTEQMTGYLIQPMSTVHFTEPVVMQYDQRTVIHGRLYDASTQRLLEHYRGPAPTGGRRLIPL